MTGNRLRLSIAILAASGWLLSGCYNEEHFDMPETDESVDSTGVFNVPDPFDGSNAVYLIRDGVPDFTKMSVMSFTDFAVEMPAVPDSSSWYTGVDRNGDTFFGCRQHRINYALNNSDHFGGNQLSYMYNALFSRLYLKNGAGRQWKVKARLSLEVFGCNAFSRFVFEGAGETVNHANLGFDWVGTGTLSAMYLMRNNSLIDNLESANFFPMPDYMSPCEPFELEICNIDNFIYVRRGDKVLWAITAEDVQDHEFPLAFYPWKGAVRFYDLSIEGDYVTQEPVAVQRENGYVNVQAPALAASGNDILLFAEGRREVTAQTDNMNAVRSNATDIIVKRSSDEGRTWDSWLVLKGGDGGVYMRPEVVNAGDRLYLFYTVDVTGDQSGDYRIEYIVSDDGGRSWNNGGEVEAAVDGYVISTLSGHGLKTSGGELVLPLQCRFGKRGTVAALYSRDGGNSWKLGSLVDGLRNNVASIVETDGKLVAYITHSSAANSRLIAESVDGGETWSKPTEATIPTGNGGFQIGGATVKGSDGTIYHFTATDAEKTSNFSGSSLNDHPQSISNGMKRLYIYRPQMELIGNGVTMTVSRDGGNSWSDARDLTDIVSYRSYIFPTGAMDAVVSGNSVILVTEGGVAVPYEGLLIYRESAN